MNWIGFGIFWYFLGCWVFCLRRYELVLLGWGIEVRLEEGLLWNLILRWFSYLFYRISVLVLVDKL